MGKISTLMDLIKNNPKSIGRSIDAHVSRWRIMRYISDEVYLKLRFFLCMNKRLNLLTPTSFNEKLQWLKLNYRDKTYEMLADKYAVKKYVEENFPEINIIPNICVWNSVEEIDVTLLPKQFVLKCTHDTGSTIICKEKDSFDLESAKNKLNKALKTNMFYIGREWVYKNIKPQILAEPYLSDTSEELRDYKFMCFNGVVKCCFVCSDRFSSKGLHVTFFDRDWNVMPFTRHYPMKKEGIPKPECYEEMIDLAEKMSKNMPFVRIDLYEIDKKVYFGEYTFFPGSGLEEFSPDEWDNKMGEWINLPER